MIQQSFFFPKEKIIFEHRKSFVDKTGNQQFFCCATTKKIEIRNNVEHTFKRVINVTTTFEIERLREKKMIYD